MKKIIFITCAALFTSFSKSSKKDNFYVQLGVERQNLKINDSATSTDPNLVEPFSINVSKKLIAPKILLGWMYPFNNTNWVFSPELYYAHLSTKARGGYAHPVGLFNMSKTLTVRYKPYYGANIRIGNQFSNDLLVFGLFGLRKEKYEFDHPLSYNNGVQIVPGSTTLKPLALALGLGVEGLIDKDNGITLRGDISRLIRFKSKKSTIPQYLQANFTTTRSSIKVRNSWAVQINLGFRF